MPREWLGMVDYARTRTPDHVQQGATGKKVLWLLGFEFELLSDLVFLQLELSRNLLVLTALIRDKLPKIHLQLREKKKTIRQQ